MFDGIGGEIIAIYRSSNLVVTLNEWPQMSRQPLGINLEWRQHVERINPASDKVTCCCHGNIMYKPTKRKTFVFSVVESKFTNNLRLMRY